VIRPDFRSVLLALALVAIAAPAATVDKPDIEWPSTVTQQALQPGAIMRAHAHRGVQREAAVLPSEHLADILRLDQAAAGKPAQHPDTHLFGDGGGRPSGVLVMPLPEHGPIPSMRRTGNCWDNARMERFVGSLKRGRTICGSSPPAKRPDFLSPSPSPGTASDGRRGVKSVLTAIGTAGRAYP